MNELERFYAETFRETGLRHGTWTAQRVQESGETAAACLARVEQDYQAEVENLPQLRKANPEYAAQHEQYLEGLITATRESLGALIVQEAM